MSVVLVLDGSSVPAANYDAAVRAAPFLLITPEALMEGQVLGFSTPALLEQFLATTPHLVDYQRQKELGQRTAEFLASTDPERVRDVQVFEVEDAQQRFYRALGRHGASVDAIDQLLATYNPLLGAPGNTAWFFHRKNCSPFGQFRTLPGGASYPDFGWFAFDNWTRSVHAGSYTVVFDQKNCMSPPALHLAAGTKINDLSVYGWDDRISSARIG